LRILLILGGVLCVLVALALALFGAMCVASGFAGVHGLVCWVVAACLGVFGARLLATKPSRLTPAQRQNTRDVIAVSVVVALILVAYATLWRTSPVFKVTDLRDGR
jgi:hypothetical protein